MRKPLLVAAGLLATAAAWIAVAGQEPESGTSGTVEVLGRTADAEMLALGEQVYAAYSATCHGAQLQGQPNWRRRLESGRMPAPPHDGTGHTWHHSDADLFRLTEEGVAAVVGGDYESDMPGFGNVLMTKRSWPSSPSLRVPGRSANDPTRRTSQTRESRRISPARAFSRAFRPPSPSSSGSR